MNFNEAQFLTYNHQNNFLADGTFRYGSTKALSIESVIDTRVSNTDGSGVKESQESLMELISGAHNFQKIIINGVDFGYGRVISINSESGPNWDTNQIRIGKNIFDIEISDSGENDLYNMTGNYLTGLKEKFSKHHLLEEFNENFTFDFSEDNKYSYVHNVSAKYFSGAEVSDPIGEARTLASGIFEQDPSFGFLTSKSGFYNNNGKKYYNEAYNLISNQCSFSKRFECHPRYNKNDPSCSNINHQLTSDENGIINITERGQIMGLDNNGGDELYNSALDALNTTINSSYDRCNKLFSGHREFYGGQVDRVDDLNSRYLTLQKNINRISSNLSYEVSYNNNPNISGSGQHTFTLSIDASQDGIRGVTEKGQLKSFVSRGEIDPVDLYNHFNVKEESFHRCGGFYSGVITNSKSNDNFFQKDRFNLVGSTLEFTRSGDTVNYTNSYADDPSVIKTNKIQALNVSCSDAFEVEVSNAFFIPNATKEILHKRGIKRLSRRQLSATCIYERPSTNFWTNPSYIPIGPESNIDYYNALKFVKNKMLEKAFMDEWITIREIDSMFIQNFQYNVSSDMNLSVSMDIIYEKN
tara:strand:- start:10753 stop:12504 length:1752 start_codon:yes stop_codon:yes gene_type:complete